MIRKALIILFLTFAAWTCTFQISIAGAKETGTAVEYKIKAAFLLNFAKFINWPDGSFPGDGQFFKICVLGNNPFASALDAIESRTIGNRKIDLCYVDDIQQAVNCHLLFISGSEKSNLQTIFKVLDGHGIIMVSDIHGFADLGGIIEFVTKDNKLAFIINLAKAREQGLEIHSALLNLATEVIQ